MQNSRSFKSPFFIDKVNSTIRKYNMIARHDRILIGLSGGADSVSLLYAMLGLRKEYLLDISAAHLDHRFRGSESEGDRRFCQDMANEVKVDIICEEIDVPRIAEEKGISAEEAGRQERYDFFARTAAEKNISKLAVGHNRDDQAETVLMRAIRGAGMSGLRGMSPVKDMHGLMVIRPLIEVQGEEIRDFVKANNLKFRYDSSNDKLVFTRNRIRHELMPYLEKNFNPNIKEVLANMAENLCAEDDFLDRFSKRKYRGIARRRRDGEIAIEIKGFKRQDEAVRKRIFRSAFEELKGDLRRLTYRHWKETEMLVDKRPINSIVNLPGGLKVTKEKKSLILKK